MTSGCRSGFFAELSWEQSTRIDLISPAFSSSRSVLAMCSGEKFGPADPPLRTMWQLGLPAVTMADAAPSRLIPRKVCGWDAARMALIAVCTDPSVPFLNPRGMDRPEAIWRCVCDSAVRAPMADQQMRSAMYCGVIGSRSSVAVGSPRSRTSRRNPRAIRSPAAMSLDPSSLGSMMSPFQPTVVLGFSKYTRITIMTRSATSRASAESRPAYSRPESTS